MLLKWPLRADLLCACSARYGTACAAVTGLSYSDAVRSKSTSHNLLHQHARVQTASFSLKSHGVARQCISLVHGVLAAHTPDLYLLCLSAATEQGDTIVANLHSTPSILNALPKTVGGFFMNYVANNEPVSAQDWLTHARSHNRCMPSNLFLFCGDRHLDLLVDPLTRKAGGETTKYFNAYRQVAYWCRLASS